MRSNLLVLAFVLLSFGRAHADPAVEVPFDATPDQQPLQGKCVKWSTGLVGTVCSFCMDDTDASCRVCRNGFDSATCSYGTRGEAPTFGTCKEVGGDQVCEVRDRAGVMRCRYSADRAACYTAPANDSSSVDAAWIESRPGAAPGAEHCIEQTPPRRGRACVRPAADGVHGRLCFFGDYSDPYACVDVSSPTVDPTFGTCDGTSDNQVCTISNARCRYWGGPQPSTRCYTKEHPASTVDDEIWIDDGRPPLDAARTTKAEHSYGSRAYRLPNKVYFGIELGRAKPGASDYYADGYGRAFVFGALGFEVRLFEGYDLPDPKMMFKNVAGTSAAFVISSFAYRYQFASSSPISFSVLGGVAVMHRSLFGTSGDQLPGLEDFPDIQQQFGVGAMVGGGLVLFGIGYVDVRAYPAIWGSSGIGDNAVSPGGTPITGNAGLRVGF